MVVDGSKCSTIRPWPKDGKIPSFGDALDARIWEGRPYHSQQLKLGIFQIGSVYKILINDLGFWHVMDGFPKKIVWEKKFAKDDGFDSVDAMLNWFRSYYKLPFTGVRIQFAKYHGQERPVCLCETRYDGTVMRETFLGRVPRGLPIEAIDGKIILMHP